MLASLRWLFLVGVCLLPLALAAKPLVLEGLTFSDELGGVELIDGWGRGTLDDPFVLVEQITGVGPATLIVRGTTWRIGNRIGSHHEVGFAVTKVVRNGTEVAWPIFDMELREFQDSSSPFGDGLSFGQATEAGKPFQSDHYRQNQDVDEPYDGVSFFDGVVEPGGQATFRFVITDTTPKYEFYLLQRRDSPLALGPPTARLADLARRPRGDARLCTREPGAC
jgi:hypothetical protein